MLSKILILQDESDQINDKHKANNKKSKTKIANS